MTLAKSSVTLNISSLTESVAVTRAGDGVISATSSNTATARVEVSGTSVKITGLKAGTAKITVKVAAGTNHTAPSDKTINVTVSLPDTSLATTRRTSSRRRPSPARRRTIGAWATRWVSRSMALSED